MKKYFILLCFAMLFVLVGTSAWRPASGEPYPERLSDYGLFTGDITQHQPAENVVPYHLNTPLFTDYAEKWRFIKFPKGQKAQYQDSIAFDFPVGTVISKTFYYYNDQRKPEKGKQLIETRILLREAAGWVALPYIWDEAQKEAYLDVAGLSTEVSNIDAKGKKRKFKYVVPNMNQCKGCHSHKGEFRPIGPSARQLNGDFPYPSGAENQLQHWAKLGLIDLPQDFKSVPQMPKWDDPNVAVAARARAYLDANCGHCHNPHGPGNTSGLFLHYAEADKGKLGFGKAPVAAGRGSGNRKYDIVPGNPDASILVYRMESLDPGIMMPEVGRTMNHVEGINLVKQWIKSEM
jgi:uncharacterized repeat protein (TIGR03806 family)